MSGTKVCLIAIIFPSLSANLATWNEQLLCFEEWQRLHGNMRSSWFAQNFCKPDAHPNASLQEEVCAPVILLLVPLTGLAPPSRFWGGRLLSIRRELCFSAGSGHLWTICASENSPGGASLTPRWQILMNKETLFVSDFFKVSPHFIVLTPIWTKSARNIWETNESVKDFAPSVISSGRESSLSAP